MTKAELIHALADAADLPKAKAEMVVDHLAQITKGQLAKGNEAILPGLGKLVVGTRAARTGRNPQTGETIQIAATKVAKFKPAKELKDAIA